MQRTGFVYILASQRNGTLYTGVTNDVYARLLQHRSGKGSHFAKKYKTFLLVYYEELDRLDDAIQREKQIKSWNRAWKLELIEQHNPQWKDLAVNW